MLMLHQGCYVAPDLGKGQLELLCVDTVIRDLNNKKLRLVFWKQWLWSCLRD